MTTEQRPDLNTLTLPELEARRDELEESIAALKSKLSSVRARHHATGEYADPDWYHRATTRLRFTGVEHQRVTRRIAAMKREQRQAQAAKVERAFVDIARERLDPIIFDTLMAKAQAAIGQ